MFPLFIFVCQLCLPTQHKLKIILENLSIANKNTIKVTDNSKYNSVPNEIAETNNINLYNII